VRVIVADADLATLPGDDERLGPQGPAAS